MTAGLRRGTRRSKSYDISPGLAAFRRKRLSFLGPIPTHLLGEGGVREMVALALFLELTGPLGREKICYYGLVLLELLSEEEAL